MLDEDYKRKFKQREMEHELYAEDQDEWSRLTPEEAHKRVIEQCEADAKAEAYRQKHGNF